MLFTPGKITTVMDGQWGSSGKGKISAYIAQYCVDKDSNLTFACNAFSSNASHTVVFKSHPNVHHVFKHLNSCAFNRQDLFYYIGQGASIDLTSLLKEIYRYNMSPKNLMISPYAAIITNLDVNFESGFSDFHGNMLEIMGDGTLKTGTTASGSGSARARKILRNKTSLLAKDVKELADFIGDVEDSIMRRLDRGESGLGEIAQGFPLSNGYKFHPYTTFRNCTLAAFCDDMMIPPSYLGNVIINLRTFPIRINSKKYYSREFSRFLTWDEVTSGVLKYEVIDSDSGPHYDDQVEIDWEKITKDSDSDVPIFEVTTLTKLPRRVFTFSKKNLEDAIKYNKPNDGYSIHLSLNFCNYLDASIRYGSYEKVMSSKKLSDFIVENIHPYLSDNVNLSFLGTSEFTEDTFDVSLEHNVINS